MAKPLTPAAERALAEAAARRAEREKQAAERAEGSERPERSGADPLRRLGAQRDRERFLKVSQRCAARSSGCGYTLLPFSTLPQERKWSAGRRQGAALRRPWGTPCDRGI